MAKLLLCVLQSRPSRYTSRATNYIQTAGRTAAAPLRIRLRISTVAMGMPKYYLPQQKCLFFVGDPSPILIHGSFSPDRRHPKQHLDRFIRFCRADGRKRQHTSTRRETEHDVTCVTTGCNCDAVYNITRILQQLLFRAKSKTRTERPASQRSTLKFTVLNFVKIQTRGGKKN